MGENGRALPLWLLRQVAEIEIPDEASSPDLIVSCGGKSVVAARTWASKFGVPYVFLCMRRSHPCNWFHTIISPIRLEAEENTIITELIPTPVTPGMIAALDSVEKRTWCMIIGGTSPDCPFNEQDWCAIAKGMNILAERENIRWLITTSRRTGKSSEAILKASLNPDITKDAIWWSEKPRRELYRFMARSEMLFVTLDSVTMVTEAVSSGKPVIAVSPNQFTPDSDDLKMNYFERLVKAGRMTVYESLKLPSFSSNEVVFNPLVETALKQPVEKLLRRLHWIE